MRKMRMSKQDEIKFENMISDDQTRWWTCPRNEKGELYISLGTVLHFLYVYGNFDMAETATVGDGKVNYHGEQVATFTTFKETDKYKLPIFTFIEKYNWMNEKQEIFLKGLDNNLHLKWREKMSHLKEFLTINF
jgi:hypothetical protein